MNQSLSIPGRVSVKTGKGGLSYIELRYNGAEAHVYLQGAHVLHYQPAEQAPVLWHSQKSNFETNRPIRGGIPVCWPWFGAHPSDTTLPAHGLARLVEWEPIASDSTPITTTVTLRYPNSEKIRASAELIVILTDDSLTVTLTTTNISTEPMPLTEALHAYFAVSDIHNISVHGLEGQPYIDTLPAVRPLRTQTGPITFTKETDRIYIDTPRECAIHDPGMNRRILVGKENSLSTVVWNPWIAKAARMPDYGDNEYPEMVCVETANCGPNALRLTPGQTHALTTRIRVVAL